MIIFEFYNIKLNKNPKFLNNDSVLLFHAKEKQITFEYIIKNDGCSVTLNSKVLHLDTIKSHIKNRIYEN